MGGIVGLRRQRGCEIGVFGAGGGVRRESHWCGGKCVVFWHTGREGVVGEFVGGEGFREGVLWECHEGEAGDGGGVGGVRGGVEEVGGG